MRRRSVLFATLMPMILKPFGAAAEDKPCLDYDAVLPSPDETLRQNFSLPDTMKDEIFWGYKPNQASPRRELMLDPFFYTALNLHRGMNGPDPVGSKLVAELGLSCRDKTPMFISRNVPLSEEEQAALQALKTGVKSFNEQPKNPSPELEFFRQIIGVVNTFRNILYEVHTDWVSRPLTPGELLANKKGDCKDFALCRYLLAREIGIPAKNLQIVLYASRDPNIMSHAALAVKDEHSGSWYIVDNTGRSQSEVQGAAMIIENTQSNFEQVKAMGLYIGNVVPVVGVTVNGIYAFDSVLAMNPANGYVIFSEAVPMPAKIGRDSDLWIEPGWHSVPTDDYPQYPVTGPGIGPR